MFEDWVRELGELEIGGLGRRALADAVAATARLRGAVDAFEARVVAAIDGLEDNGPRSSTVLRSATRCSQRDADRRAARAQTLDRLPAAAEALAQGQLSTEHIEVLGRAMDATSAEAVNSSDLVDRACRRPADLHARDARDWVRRQQPDADIEELQRRRYTARRLSIWDNDDGMTVLHGEFDPVTGAQLRNKIEAETNRLFHADGGRDHATAARTASQRRADALTDILLGSVASTTTPPATRHQIPVIAVIEDTDITRGHLPDGTPVARATLERLACGSDLFAMLFSEPGEPLWHGSQVRLATDAQWRALIARDGGCVICTASPSRCQAHHLIPWQTQGPTDITNLVLLCNHHHHLVHDNGHTLRHTTNGWELIPP